MIDAAAEELHALRVEIADLRAAIGRLEGAIDNKRVRDEADRQALEHVALAIGSETFFASDLVAHCAAVPALAANLLAADVEPETRAIGAWLAGREGARVGSLRLRRVGRGSAGNIWQFIE